MPSIKTANRDPVTRIVNRGRDRWEKRRIAQGAASTGSAALDAHEAALDPHPQYLTPAEGDVLYQPIDFVQVYSEEDDPMVDYVAINFVPDGMDTYTMRLYIP